MKKIILFLLLVSFPLFAVASKTSQHHVHKKVKPHKVIKKTGQEILREMYIVQQLWEHSKNYEFGTTLAQDYAKAYAWFAIYVDSLPASYPGVLAQLGNLKKKMSVKNSKEIWTYYRQFRDKYDLHFRLSESDLTRYFKLKNNKKEPVFSLQKNKALKPIHQEIEYLYKKHKVVIANVLEQALEKAEAILEDSVNAHIVYGKIIVDGPIDATAVSASVPILKDGYFVTVIETFPQALYFRLSAYKQTKVVVKKTENDEINLGRIHVKKLPTEELAGFVGKIIRDPHYPEKPNFVLRIASVLQNKDGEQDEWLTPITHVTRVANGQFFAENLTPGHYRLTITNRQKQKKVIEINLKPGELKTLASVEFKTA